MIKIFKLILISVLFLFFFSCNKNNNQETKIAENNLISGNEIEFDSLKAIKFGADEYGMKKYVMAFLKRGPNKITDSVKSMELQNAHLKNIGRLAEEGKLIIAGPFLDKGDLRGIYIFNVETVEEAKLLTQTDPAIKAGSLIMELKLWYGSAALMEINDIHKKLQKKSITD
jgi:uncharacterized protein YciI